MPLEERLDRHLQREERRLRARIRQRGDQRIDAPLPTRDQRPARQLRPIELQHLARPIAGALSGPHRPRPQPLQVRLHQPHRARVPVLRAQDLRHPRRLDQRPLPKQPPQHRLQHVKLRPSRRAPVARRLIARDQPRDRPPIDPQPHRDLPPRDPVRRQHPHLRPLQRAPHLRPLARHHRSVEPRRRGGHDQRRGKWRTFRLPILAQYWAARVKPRRGRTPGASVRRVGI